MSVPDPAFGAERSLGELLRGVVALGDPSPGPTTTCDSPFGRPGLRRSIHGGVQWEFTFGNGYGASVVCHDVSYGGNEGLWELAVIGRNGRLAYDTPITDDVIGRLSESDVAALLESIEALS